MAQQLENRSISDAVELLKDNGFDGLADAVTVLLNSEDRSYNVIDPDVIQSILVHLKQRAPPGATPRQTQLQAVQTDLFAAT